jgi:hypothetical protein
MDIVDVPLFATLSWKDCSVWRQKWVNHYLSHLFSLSFSGRRTTFNTRWIRLICRTIVSPSWYRVGVQQDLIDVVLLGIKRLNGENLFSIYLKDSNNAQSTSWKRSVVPLVKGTIYLLIALRMYLTAFPQWLWQLRMTNTVSSSLISFITVNFSIIDRKRWSNVLTKFLAIQRGFQSLRCKDIEGQMVLVVNHSCNHHDVPHIAINPVVNGLALTTRCVACKLITKLWSVSSRNWIWHCEKPSRKLETVHLLLNNCPCHEIGQIMTNEWILRSHWYNSCSFRERGEEGQHLWKIEPQKKGGKEWIGRYARSARERLGNCISVSGIGIIVLYSFHSRRITTENSLRDKVEIIGT